MSMVNNSLERLEGSQASMFWTWLKTFRQILFDCSFCGKFTMGKRPFGGARLDDVIFFQRCNLRGKIGPNYLIETHQDWMLEWGRPGTC